MMNHPAGPNPAPYQYPPPYPPYGGYPPQYASPNPWRRPVRRSANIICFGLLLVILLGSLLVPCFTGISEYLSYTFGFKSPETLSVIEVSSDLLVAVLMFLIPIVVMRLWIGIPSRVAFPMRGPRRSIAIPAVLICFGVSAVGMIVYALITTFFQEVLGLTPSIPEFPEPNGIPATILYFFRLAVIPSIFEELMFRGVIMQSLRRFGDSFALVCSSILFALAHYNLVQGPRALLIGLAMGFFVLRTGSLWVGILIHFVNNSFAILIDFLMRDMPAREAGIFTLIIFAVELILGFIGLALLLLNHSGIFSLSPSGYPIPERSKYSAFFLTVLPIVYILGVVALTCLYMTPY